MGLILLVAVLMPPDLMGVVEIATARVLARPLLTDPTLPPGSPRPRPVPDPGPSPNPEPAKCDRCGGSGWVTHGDGHRTRCPECSEGGEVKPVQPETQPERWTVVAPNGERGVIDHAPQQGEQIQFPSGAIWEYEGREGPTAFWSRVRPAPDAPVARDSDVMVLVFGAAWCGPCQRYRPVWQSARDDGMRIEYVDIDSEPQLRVRYGVRQVPTTVVLRQGREVSRRVGPLSRDELARLAGDGRSGDR